MRFSWKTQDLFRKTQSHKRYVRYNKRFSEIMNFPLHLFSKYTYNQQNKIGTPLFLNQVPTCRCRHSNGSRKGSRRMWSAWDVFFSSLRNRLRIFAHVFPRMCPLEDLDGEEGHCTRLFCRIVHCWRQEATRMSFEWCAHRGYFTSPSLMGCSSAG